MGYEGVEMHASCGEDVCADVLGGSYILGIIHERVNSHGNTHTQCKHSKKRWKCVSVDLLIDTSTSEFNEILLVSIDKTFNELI